MRDKGVSGFYLRGFGYRDGGSEVDLQMNELIFVAWIASGTIHMEGVTSGSLGGHPGATEERACAMQSEKRKAGIAADIYKIGQGISIGGCDWGCEFPVIVRKVECAEEQPPKRTVLK